jgi:hypothetical protein
MTLAFKRISISILVLSIVCGGLVYPHHQTKAFFGIPCPPFFCADPPQEIEGAATTVTTGVTSVSTTTNAAVSTAKFVADGTPWERVVTDQLLNPTYCDKFNDSNIFLDLADRAGKVIAGSDKTDVSNTFFPAYKVDSTLNQLTACWVPLSIAVDNAKGASISQSDNIEHNRTIINQKKADLQTQLAQYEQQEDQAFSDVFEGIMYNFTMAVQQEASIRGIKTLSNVLGNRDPDLLKQALQSQIYGIQEINKSAKGNERTRLIASSLYKNQVLGDLTGLTTAKNLAAVEASKYQVPPDTLDWTSPDYWGKVADAGDERAWSETHILTGMSDVDRFLADSEKMAQQEMQSGNQFKNVRTCTDKTAEQTKINSDLAAATKKVGEAALALQILKNQGGGNTGISDVDRAIKDQIDQAQQVYDAAVQALNDLQNKVGTGLLEPCDRNIKTLAKEAHDASDKWMQSLFDQTKYNTTHPTLAGKIASKLGKTLADELFGIQNGTTFGGFLSNTANSLLPVGINEGLAQLKGQLNNTNPNLPNQHQTSGNK